jgi:protein O-mannosyl-transferase
MEDVTTTPAVPSSPSQEALIAPIHDSLFSFPPAKVHPAEKRHNLIAFFILSILILAAYSNSFQAGFTQDSRSILLEDPRLRAAGAENLQKILLENYWWPKGESGLYRPFTTLTYLFNYSIIGNEDRAAGYHWINLSLHICNAFFVYLLARRILEDRRIALATAVLWSLHPICTEAVTNVVGRADELAALGVLATMLLYIRSAGVGGWRRLAWFAVMAAVVTLAVFSKENAVVVALLLPLYDLSFRLGRGQVGQVRNAIDHLALYCSRGYVALIPPLLLFIHQRNSMFHKGRPVLLPFVDNPILGVDFITARLTAVKVFGHSLWLLLWPQKLSCDYSFNRISLVDWHMRHLEDWQALAGLALLITLVAIGIACWRRSRMVSFWIGFGLVTMLPTSNFLVPIGSIMAERFLYLPSIAFAACMGIALAAVCRRLRIPERWLAAAIVLIAAGSGIRTFQRNRDWADDETLWTKALTVAPESFKPHISLAQIWFAREGPSPRSLHQAETAIAILNKLPDRLNVAPIYRDLGFYYLSKGDSISPRDPKAAQPDPESNRWYVKALAVLQHGAAIDRDFNAAARHAMAVCIANSPACPTFGLAQLYVDLGVVYVRMNRPDDAISAFLYARKISPADPSIYRSLAGAYLKKRDSTSAAVSLWGALIVGSSLEATPYLLRLYDNSYPRSCATYFHEGREFLNLGCPIVRNQRCTAIEDLASTNSEAGELQRALEIRKSYIQQGCSAALP